MLKILLSTLLIFLSTLTFAQKFKPHIGLNDRLMNTFLLCDRAVSESISAKYSEVDIIKYNEEYTKFSICSKKADELAIHRVLRGQLNCNKAAHLIFKQGLACQISVDYYNENIDNSAARSRAANAVRSCLKNIVTICNDYLKEKHITTQVN